MSEPPGTVPTALNFSIFPDPEALNPIVVFVFVQSYTAAGLPENSILEKDSSAQIV